MDGIAFCTKFGDLITTDHEILNVENESRCGHKKRSDRARWFHELDSELPNDDKGYIRKNVVFTVIPSSVTEARKNTDNSKGLLKLIVQRRTEWQREPSSRVNEGTAIALVQSGLPKEWWDSVMECCCYLRNVHDKMTDGKTAFEKRYGHTFDGPSIPFWNIGWVHPKDKSRVHQFGKKTMKRIVCSTCGERLVRRLDHSR